MHVVCFNTTSRTLTALAREALVNLIMKNCKWEQLNWAEKMLKTDAYQRLMDVASEVNMPEFRYHSFACSSFSTFFSFFSFSFCSCSCSGTNPPWI